MNESTLVDFDNLTREFVLESCDGQLLEFSLNQENCRNQWLTSERELERMRQQISEAEHLKAKLEAQNHHAHGLLQSEIRKRIKEQQEKKEVEEKLELVRRTLCDDQDKISVDASERLKPILFQGRRKSSGMDRLETIDEIASASSLSLEKSDEELELSGLVRSYRDIKRNSGPSVNAPEAYQEVEPPIDYEEQPEPDELLANTNLVRSSQGLVKATSAFDTEPGIEQQQETYARRSHSYKKLTVLHSANCLSCRQRIRFGRAALKCVDCGEVCHLDCEESMPDCSATKKKKTVTFFSSPNNI